LYELRITRKTQLELSQDNHAEKLAWMCKLGKIFHIKGRDLEYVSHMCNIAALEVEIAIRRRKVHRKLFDVGGDSR